MPWSKYNKAADNPSTPEIIPNVALLQMDLASEPDIEKLWDKSAVTPKSESTIWQMNNSLLTYVALGCLHAHKSSANETGGYKSKEETKRNVGEIQTIHMRIYLHTYIIIDHDFFLVLVFYFITFRPWFSNLKTLYFFLI